VDLVRLDLRHPPRINDLFVVGDVFEPDLSLVDAVRIVFRSCVTLKLTLCRGVKAEIARRNVRGRLGQPGPCAPVVAKNLLCVSRKEEASRCAGVGTVGLRICTYLWHPPGIYDLQGIYDAGVEVAEPVPAIPIVVENLSRVALQVDPIFLAWCRPVG